MHRYLSILRSNPFFKNNLVFFLGSASVGALNYLYYPVVGRLMPPSAFGEVQTLISLFLQLTIFLSVLSLVAVNLIANSKRAGAHGVVTELQMAAFWVSVLLLALTVVMSGLLKEALQFDSVWPFILLAIALVAAVPFTFQTAYLRGKEWFGAVSIANLLVAGGKIVLSVLFVIVGFGTNGAIGGLIAAQLIGLLYAYGKLKTRIGNVLSSLRNHWWPDMQLVLGELKHVGYALIGSLAVMLLLSLDVIIVKYFFDAHTAGLYAGVATVARIIFFLTASIAQVLLPAVKIDASPKINQSLLVKSVLILSSLSLPVLFVCILAPGFVMGLLMGNQYLEFSGLLPLLTLAIFFVSLLNLFVFYSLALRRYALSVIALAGMVATYGMILVKHDSLQAIVAILLIGSFVVTCISAGWLAYKERGSYA